MRGKNRRWVLLKEQSGTTTAHSVYEHFDDLLARVEKIAHANRQYPMVQHGERSWTVGPTEDEGFFGHQPVYLTAVSVPYVEGSNE